MKFRSSPYRMSAWVHLVESIYGRETRNIIKFSSLDIVSRAPMEVICDRKTDDSLLVTSGRKLTLMLAQR